MLLEVTTKAYVLKERRRLRDKEDGKVGVETDERHFQDIAEMVEEGADPTAIMAAWSALPTDEDEAERLAELEQSDRLMAAILGPGWEAREPEDDDDDDDEDDEEAEE